MYLTATFKSIITETLTDDLSVLTALLGKYADSGEEFNLDEIFYAFTLASFSTMAFGLNLGVLTPEGINTVPFGECCRSTADDGKMLTGPALFSPCTAKAFDAAQMILSIRTVNPLWKTFERFTKEGKEMREAVAIMNDFAYKVIDDVSILYLSASRIVLTPAVLKSPRECAKLLRVRSLAKIFWLYTLLSATSMGLP